MSSKSNSKLLYSPEFQEISAQTHKRFTACLGPYSCIWHVSVQRAKSGDPQVVSITNSDGSRGSNPDVGSEDRDRMREHVREEVDARNRSWINSLNQVLERLQSKSAGSSPRKLLKVNFSEFEDRGRLGFVQEEALAFTIWMPDPQLSTLDLCDEHALRGRVHVEIFPEFFTITITIDTTKPWNLPAMHHSSGAAPGGLRQKIIRLGENVISICERQIDEAIIDRDLIPEVLPGGQAEAAALLEAADYVYSGIWADFCRHFEITIADIAGDTGEVFGNFRGFILPTKGYNPSAAENSGNRSSSASIAQGRPEVDSETATTGKSKFHRFDGEGAEPNAVVKAFWPFFRRITPFADHRECVACGVMRFRGILMSSFASATQFADGQESHDRRAEVPFGFLPELPREDTIPCTWSGITLDPGTHHLNESFPTEDPERYLVLTKFQPHRRQIGRVMERINALGTLRLIALKDWSIIREVDAQIRICGKELDEVLRIWLKDREALSKQMPELVDFGDQCRGQVRNLLSKSQLCRLEGATKPGFTPDSRLDEYQELLSSPDVRFPKETIVAKDLICIFQTHCRDWNAISRLLGDLGAEEIHRSAHSPGGVVLVDVLRKFAKGDPESFSELSCDAQKVILALAIDYCLRYNDRLLSRNRQTLRAQRVGKLSANVERNLISIAADLDQIGIDAVGGIHYRIARSRYYAEQFRKVMQLLRSGNIETWMAYDQFATRGLEPTFNLIDSIGQRMAALRQRLQGVMENVQTSAIVSQTEATRGNTAELELISRQIEFLIRSADKFGSRIQWWGLALAIIGLLLTGVSTFHTVIQLYQMFSK